jgi:hypothetical protein
MERERTTETLDGVALNIQPHSSDSSDSSGVRIQTFVDLVGIPMGLVGPSQIKDKDDIQRINDNFSIENLKNGYTCTENRSYLCKLLDRCGSVQLFMLNGSVPQGPIFLFASSAEAILFAEHVPGFLKQFATDTERACRHITLQELTPHMAGSNVLVEFDYLYTDIVDRHAVTIATQTACYLFLQTNGAKELGVQGLVVTNEVKFDKRASLENLKESGETQLLRWSELRPCSGECLYTAWTAMGETKSYYRHWTSIPNPADMVTTLPACGHDAMGVAEFSLNHLAVGSVWKKKQLKLSLLLLSRADPPTRQKRHSWAH